MNFNSDDFKTREEHEIFPPPSNIVPMLGATSKAGEAIWGGDFWTG